MTAVHILPSFLFERHFSITLPTKLLLPPTPRGLHIKTQHEFPLSTVCQVRPTHLIVLGFITLIIMQYSPASFYILSRGSTCLLQHSFLFNTLFLYLNSVLFYLSAF